MVEERFADGKSLLHRLDPRIKILIAFSFAIIVATTKNILPLFFAFCFISILFLTINIKIRHILKPVLFVNTFTIILVLTLPFTCPGKTIYTLGRFAISKEGLIYGGLIFFKSNLILICMVLLLATSSVFSLAHALHHLHIPAKLAQLIFFTFRYIHVIYQEYKKLISTLKIRCFKPKTNLHTYKTYAYLIANLLIKSYERSERVYKAMLCRGFNGTFPLYKHFKMESKDYLFAVISGAYMIFLAYLAWK